MCKKYSRKKRSISFQCVGVHSKPSGASALRSSLFCGSSSLQTWPIFVRRTPTELSGTSLFSPSYSEDIIDWLIDIHNLCEIDVTIHHGVNNCWFTYQKFQGLDQFLLIEMNCFRWHQNCFHVTLTRKKMNCICTLIDCFFYELM